MSDMIIFLILIEFLALIGLFFVINHFYTLSLTDYLALIAGWACVSVLVQNRRYLGKDDE